MGRVAHWRASCVVTKGARFALRKATNWRRWRSKSSSLAPNARRMARYSWTSSTSAIGTTPNGWPREGQIPKSLDVNLGVNLGCRGAAVAKYLAHIQQGGSFVEELGCQTVPEEVGTSARPEPRDLEPSRDYCTEDSP